MSSSLADVLAATLAALSGSYVTHDTFRLVRRCFNTSPQNRRMALPWLSEGITTNYTGYVYLFLLLVSILDFTVGILSLFHLLLSSLTPGVNRFLLRFVFPPAPCLWHTPPPWCFHPP